MKNDQAQLTGFPLPSLLSFPVHKGREKRKHTGAGQLSPHRPHCRSSPRFPKATVKTAATENLEGWAIPVPSPLVTLSFYPLKVFISHFPRFIIASRGSQLTHNTNAEKSQMINIWKMENKNLFGSYKPQFKARGEV